MDIKRPDGVVAGVLAGLGGATLGALLLAARGLAKRSVKPDLSRTAAVQTARRLNRAAGTLAGSVLFDSAVEHYRGQFHNPAMFTPLVTSSFSLAVSAHGLADTRVGAHAARDVIYAGTALTGLVGTGFHLFNIAKRPGGFSWQNLFYSAPPGAPAALMLSGLLGFLSERVRNTPPGTAPVVLGLPAGRVLGVVTGAGIFGTVGEAGLLHFRGQFHDPFMLLPVTMPPVAALLTAVASVSSPRPRPLTRWWLRATAILGLAGTGFHALGVGRDMGGWRNWRQNVLNGPPLPAPPAFTGLALVGLAALRLLEDVADV
ncbi:hypothetical protein [Lichenicoccus sp.]|uniref:hypothetical protein n=1 Tax=Lichenicoccus sp. TaxID=2781899 RepID=UPI003D11697A